jgi:hypothetical protein
MKQQIWIKLSTGNLYTTNQGYEIDIEYSSRRKCSIKFKWVNIEEDRCFKQVSRGEISNPSHRECFWVGFIGQGEFKPNKHHKIYSCWYGMEVLQWSFCQNTHHIKH